MLDNAGLYVLSHTHRVTVTVHCLWKQITSFCTEVFSIPDLHALIPVFLTGVCFTPGLARVSPLSLISFSSRGQTEALLHSKTERDEREDEHNGG